MYVRRDVAIRAFKKSIETRPENEPSRSENALANLSDRELHIFHLLGSGLGTRQIARSLKADAAVAVASAIKPDQPPNKSNPKDENIP
jgi:DNA-binding NarL/FixJ family response regulator